MIKRIPSLVARVAGLVAIAGPASAVEEPEGSFGSVDERTGIWYLYDAANTETTS